VTKFGQRVHEISRSGSAVSVATYTYNIRAIPVLSYVSQLIPLPHNAHEIERGSLFKVMKMATNSLRHADFFQLHKAGGPKLRSLTAASAAALFRTAAKTVPSWPQWKLQLTQTAQECLPLGDWGRGLLSPRFWDSSPIASNLDKAFHCFPGDNPGRQRHQRGRG